MMRARGLVVLCHHAGEVDGAEVSDEILCREQHGIFQYMQDVRLFFPGKKLERLFDSIEAFIEEWDVEHRCAQIQMLVFVWLH
jgi:hypothetical protein